MQLGEAFIQLSLQLPPNASKEVEQQATKSGQAAADAFSKAADKAVKIEAKDAFKQFPDQAKKSGTEAGTALGKAVSDASSKMVVKTPELKNAYAKAGEDAGKALANSVNDAAKKMTIKSPDITTAYKVAGEKAGTALAKSVNDAARNVKVDPPDLAGEFAREGDKAGTSFKDKLKASTSGIGQLGSALGVQLIGAFDSEVNLSETTRRFQQQLGTTKDQAKALGLAAGSLYANGLADGMDTAEEAIKSVIGNISGIADQGVPAIKEVAQAALGVSKAFGQDLDTTLRATGQLMRTGLAKDGKEALDIIATGLAKIPGAAEDLLDTFQEYSVQFKKIGLDGKDALGIIAQAMEGGARNTDLAADALKEFSIRAVDGSKNVEEAFKDIGLDGEKMVRTFAEGGPAARKAFGEVVDALNKMDDPLKRNLAGVELFGTQWEDLGDAFRKVDLKTAARDLGEIDNAADKIGGNTFGEKFKSNLSKLSGVATVIGGALGISFASSFDDAMDFKATNDKVARELGLTGKAAKDIGKAAGDLYSSGLGDGLADVSEAISTVGKSMPDIAKQGVPALQAVTAAALKLQKNFDVDIADSSNAVGKMIKTGLVKDATEGFDLIATGMSKIPRASVDLIDTVNEYSVQFQKLGLTGKDTFGLIQQLMKGGARDTDLAADAIKEFSIRAVDGSSTSAAAFKQLGFNAKDLTATFAKGGPEARAAFGQVTDALNKMEDPVKRNAAGVALFGTQWEDLGGAFKSVDLKTAASGLGDISKANAQVTKTSPTQVVQQFQRAIQVAFIEVLADKVIPAFAKFIEFVKNNQGLLKTLAVAVGVLGTAYIALNTAMAISAGGGLLAFMKTAVTSTKAWTAAQWLLNTALKDNPIGIVVTAVAALVAALVILYKNNETVRKAIDAAWAAIKKAMGAVADWWTKTAWPALKSAWEAMKPTIEAVGKAIAAAWEAVKKVFTSNEFLTAAAKQWDNFKTTVTGIWKIISGAVQAAWAIIKGTFEIIKNVLSGDFSGAWKALVSMIQGVWDGIKKIIVGAWDVLKSGPLGQAIAFLGGVFKQAWEGLKSAIESVWNGIKSVISGAWQGVMAILNPAINFIKSTFGPVFTWLRDTIIKPVWDGIKLAIQVAWVAIQLIYKSWEIAGKVLGAAIQAFYNGVIKPVWDGIKSFITTTWNAIKTGVFDAWQTYIKGPFTAMWNAFKSFFETLWNGLKTFITTTWNAIKTGVFIVWENYIKGPFTAMWNAFKTFFTTLWNALKTFLTTTWTAIKTTIFDVWAAYIKGPFTAMWNAFKAFFTTLWTAIKTFLSATWTAIKTTVFDVWANYIKGPFTAMWNAFKAFLNTLWNGIKSLISAAWNWLKSSVFEPLSSYIRGPLVNAWNTAKSGIVNAWNAVKAPVQAGWNWLKSNVFTPLSNFITKDVPNAFSRGVTAIQKAWEKVRDIVSNPIKFVVNTVIRDGIVKGFNAVASKVGVGTIDFKGMATGGVLPGYTPGRDVHMFTSPTGGNLALSGGEAVMRPEFTRVMGKGAIDRLNAAARTGGVTGVRQALGLARGGTIGRVRGYADGGVVDTVSSWWEGLSGMVKGPLETIGNVVKGARSIAASPWLKDMLVHSVEMLMKGVKNVVFGAHTGGGSAGQTNQIGNVGAGTGYRWQIGVLQAAGLNPRISSTTGGGHAANSWHYKGRAIDIGNESMKIFNWIKQNYGSRSLELIYGPAGGGNIWHGKPHNYGASTLAAHYNHIHWAIKNGAVLPKGLAKYDDGGWLEPGQTGVNMGRRPEAVLTPEESAGLKGLGLGELIDKLDELIDAVERVAPGVTAGIRGAGAGLRAAGRAV